MPGRDRHREGRFQRVRLAREPAGERDPARERLAQRANDRQIGGHAGLRVARSYAPALFRVPDFRAREIGQLEVVEEDLHELFARQRERERVVAAALPAFVAGAARAAGAFRPGNAVAGHVFAVARQHELAIAAAPEAERRLRDVLLRHAHFAALLHVGKAPLADHLLHGVLDLRLVPAQEALAVDGALAAAVRAAVDEVEHHRTSGLREAGHDDLCTRRYHSASRRTCFSV